MWWIFTIVYICGFHKPGHVIMEFVQSKVQISHMMVPAVMINII